MNGVDFGKHLSEVTAQIKEALYSGKLGSADEFQNHPTGTDYVLPDGTHIEGAGSWYFRYHTIKGGTSVTAMENGEIVGRYYNHDNKIIYKESDYW